MYSGHCKRSLGDYKGALKDLNRADELVPNVAFILYGRGDVKRSLGDLDGALEDLNLANHMAPDSGSIIHARGVVKYYRKDYEGALQDLKRGVIDDCLTLSHRAAVKYALGDLKGASKDIRKAFNMDDRDTFCREWKIKIENSIRLKETLYATQGTLLKLPY